MSDDTVTQRLSTEGADPLTLAGVNDSNLIELSRLGDMPDAALLTLGRDLLKKRLQKLGSDLDSMSPEEE